MHENVFKEDRIWKQCQIKTIQTERVKYTWKKKTLRDS